MKQLEPKAPVKTDLKGVIGCVVEYLTKRINVGQFDQKDCHILIDRDNVEITLITNEADEYTRKGCRQIELQPEVRWVRNQPKQGVDTNRTWFVYQDEPCILCRPPNQYGVGFNPDELYRHREQQDWTCSCRKWQSYRQFRPSGQFQLAGFIHHSNADFQGYARRNNRGWNLCTRWTDVKLHSCFFHPAHKQHLKIYATRWLTMKLQKSRTLRPKSQSLKFSVQRPRLALWWVGGLNSRNNERYILFFNTIITQGTTQRLSSWCAFTVLRVLVRIGALLNTCTKMAVSWNWKNAKVLHLHCIRIAIALQVLCKTSTCSKTMVCVFGRKGINKRVIRRQEIAEKP